MRGVIICGNYPVYRFEGYLLEWHPACGPIKLRKDFEPAARTEAAFWEAANRFARLTEAQRAQCRVVQ